MFDSITSPRHMSPIEEGCLDFAVAFAAGNLNEGDAAPECHIAKLGQNKYQKWVCFFNLQD